MVKDPLKRDANRGQDTLHKIRNTNTGEENEVEQAYWRQEGKNLRADGWVRLDEDGTEIPETDDDADDDEVTA